MRRPRTFDVSIVPRFSDLDIFGHVNSKHYIDYVISSRFAYIHDTFGLTVRDFQTRGFGFYLSALTMRYLHPISVSVLRIRTISWVSRLDGSTFEVTFQLKDPSDNRDYSSGSFECRVIDLQSGKPTTMPTWIEDLFFEQAPGPP